jgi:hypothetical protein
VLITGTAMSRLMDEALSKVKALSEEEQEAIASLILREIESERHWDGLFAQTASADLLSRMADEALADAKAGQVRK